MTKDLERRIGRLELAIVWDGKLKAMQSLAADDFTFKWGEKFTQIADAIRDQGKAAVAQRLLDASAAVERLIFLLQVGLCINAVMVMSLYLTGDPDGVLPQWEIEATQLLRGVAGLPIVPFEPVTFLAEGIGDASPNDAVKLFEAKRRKSRWQRPG